MLEIEYLIDKNGDKKAVIIPIELWKKIMPIDEDNLDNLPDAIEDYCLNKAMEEGLSSPLLDRESALKFLEE